MYVVPAKTSPGDENEKHKSFPGSLLFPWRGNKRDPGFCNLTSCMCFFISLTLKSQKMFFSGGIFRVFEMPCKIYWSRKFKFNGCFGTYVSCFKPSTLEGNSLE